MQDIELPDNFDDLDPDDFYDDIEDWLELQLPAMLSGQVGAPSILADDLLAFANTIIHLDLLHQKLLKALAFLDHEMDTGLLKMRLQPLEDHLQLLRKRLQISNDMVYFFDTMKQTRKKAKRVTRRAKRASTSERFKALEQEADELTDQYNFLSQIDAYASQGLDTQLLLDAFKRMEKQFEKMREALDAVLDTQSA